MCGDPLEKEDGVNSALGEDKPEVRRRAMMHPLQTHSAIKKVSINLTLDWRSLGHAKTCNGRAAPTSDIPLF